MLVTTVGISSKTKTTGMKWHSSRITPCAVIPEFRLNWKRPLLRSSKQWAFFSHHQLAGRPGTHWLCLHIFCRCKRGFESFQTRSTAYQQGGNDPGARAVLFIVNGMDYLGHVTAPQRYNLPRRQFMLYGTWNTQRLHLIITHFWGYSALSLIRPKCFETGRFHQEMTVKRQDDDF